MLLISACTVDITINPAVPTVVPPTEVPKVAPATSTPSPTKKPNPCKLWEDYRNTSGKILLGSLPSCLAREDLESQLTCIETTIDRAHKKNYTEDWECGKCATVQGQLVAWGVAMYFCREGNQNTCDDMPKYFETIEDLLSKECDQ